MPIRQFIISPIIVLCNIRIMVYSFIIVVCVMSGSNDK